jgi:hypothetical protein
MPLTLLLLLLGLPAIASWAVNTAGPVDAASQSPDDGIAVMRLTVGIRRQGQRLDVIEDWLYANAGKTTDAGLDGRGQGAVTFLLPQGATNVQIKTANPPKAIASPNSDTVVVNAVIRPASGLNTASLHHLTAVFSLPGAGAQPTLLLPTRYFIGVLQVFALGSRLYAPGFTQTTLQGDKSIPAFSKEAVAPGSTLAIGIDGPPAAAPATGIVPAVVAPNFPTVTVAIMSALGFGLLLAFGAFGRRPLALASGKPPELLKQRAQLIDDIAELDLLHARGQIREVEYRHRRSEARAHLLTVARQLDN